MSKQGIYDQLTSEFDKYPPEEAQYTIDHLKVNFNENALKTAESYQKNMSMSTDAIKEQLVSPYGDKFTEEEAEYATQHLEN